MTQPQTQTATDGAGPKKKRKYTVSDKVRVANRLNLEKARAVDKPVQCGERLVPGGGPEKTLKNKAKLMLIAKDIPGSVSETKLPIAAKQVRDGLPCVTSRLWKR